MDGGVIAKMKGLLRKRYCTWVTDLVQRQLMAGTPPSEIRVPTDEVTSKTNLFRWLGEIVGDMNTLYHSSITSAWEEEKTELLSAWDKAVQVEAVQRCYEIFPNLVRGEPLHQDVTEA